jgi:hypothetical protein
MDSSRPVDVNPSRLIALSLLLTSSLYLARIVVVEEPQFSLRYTLLAVSGLFMFCGSLYGLVQYEENPIVTEYGPMAYLILFGSIAMSVGSVALILTA